MQHAIHIRLTYAAQTGGSWNDTEGIFQRYDFLCFCFDFKMNNINQGCVRVVKTFQIPPPPFFLFFSK